MMAWEAIALPLGDARMRGDFITEHDRFLSPHLNDR
jgi:hypothetical protein